MNSSALPAHCRDLLPKAVFKREYTDFIVDECLGFEPDGEGSHLWVQLRKTDCNTADVIASLAEILNVQARDIGYSGLKDKHAVTSQWISLPFAINDPVPEVVGNQIAGTSLPAGVEILQLTKSGKKLRRGAHRMNAFKIILRELSASHDVIEKNLQVLTACGFPNYFGTQRFGRDGRNIASARNMFSSKKRKLSRFKRSMYLSAARSFLFNAVLAERVKQGTWLKVLPGEVCMLDGSNSVFTCETPDDEIQNRHENQDIHTTGPMFGEGKSLVDNVVAEIEENCMQSEEILTNGLVAAGLKAERRALRAIAHHLQWNWLDSQTLELSFSLQRGVYATSMLQEIVDVQQTGITS